MKIFKVGVIGLGQRGGSWIRNILTSLPQVQITALCDKYEDRVQDCANTVLEKTGKKVALLTQDYRQLISDPCVEVVLIFSSWDTHVEMTCFAFELGKAVAVEVGGVSDVSDCYKLVAAYERTKTPFMLLENCCYGEIEMTVTDMVRKGILGTVVHCRGGYQHDLRNEIAGGKENRHYRLNEYLLRNCENYPTHEIGPIAKLLNINNGNRFLSLCSMSSKSCGMQEYLTAQNSPLQNQAFAQGDVFTTMIKCAGGETVTITLDTTLPRYYSRDFTVCGTKGRYEEQTNSLFLDTEEHRKSEFNWRGQWGNMDSYMEQYRHPLWQDYRASGVVGDHDGIDYLVINAFFDALEKDAPMPIDVYDAATWTAITALSEQSVNLGGAPVAFPDFTSGKWQHKKTPVSGKYSLI